MRGALQPSHIIILAIVVLVLFGAGKLQGFTRSLMQSARIVKAEAKAMKDEDAAATPPLGQIAAAQPIPAVVPPVVAQPLVVQPVVAQPVVAQPVVAPAPAPAAPEAPAAAPRTDG